MEIIYIEIQLELEHIWTSATHRSNTGHTGDNSDMWPNVELRYIIDPRAITEYDAWSAKLKAGGPSWYLRSQCFGKLN